MAEMNNVPYEQSDLYKLRHSAAHVMAEAVLSLFPEAKLAIGPPIDDGFYYDFDLGKDGNGKPVTFAPEDIEAIEQRMKELVKQNARFERSSKSVEEAKAFFADQPYKVELIQDLAAGRVDENGNQTGEPVSEVGIYQHRQFVDLCRGPHVDYTSRIKPNAIKLLRTSGAYWRGDEKRPQLQRIYGTAWQTKEELEQYLYRLEEARKRDHRLLGKELDLFSVSEDVGPGLILWHPKGAMLRVLVEDFSRQSHLRSGYEWVFSPHIGRAKLWETSGHLGFYKENMYAPMDIEGEDYYAKPMNCPFHIQIYKSHIRSYRDLPKRYAEFGTVYRYERSGVLHGLTRVRGFTQDDAHIFCRPDQVEEEISRALEFSLYILRSCGLTDFRAYLATRPAKFVGEPADWDKAAEALRRAVEAMGVPYETDEGGGAFYGPKIDLKVNDALGREWQLSTIQFDFNLPARFGLEFIGEDGQAHQPYMVHRALLGSMERFMGVLIEHFNGAFPVWMAPVQAVVIPITDRHVEYAKQVAAELAEAGLRVEVDDSNGRMNAKIRNAQLQKVPYMLVAGDREAQEGLVAVRTRNNEDRGAMVTAEFIAHAVGLITNKSLEL